MSNVKLDPITHDFSIEENNLVIVEDIIDNVVQKLRQRLKFFFAEWFLDNTLGVPYFQEILGKGKDPTRINAILKAAIMDVPNVIELEVFETDFNGLSRTAEVKFKVRTIEGLSPLITENV